jgi:hypothetical protein
MVDRAVLSGVLRLMKLQYVAMLAERASDPLFRELAGDELLLRMEQQA